MVNMASVGINKETCHSVHTLSLARDEAAGWPTPAETVLTAAAPVSASGRGSNSDPCKKVEVTE